MIVVDTSVLIDLFRGHSTPATELFTRLEDDEEIAIPGICLQELLQGAKDETEWKILVEYVGTHRLLYSANPRTTHIHAARIFFDLRRRGVTVRSTTDCWIAQLTIESDSLLLHDDRDFEQISRFTSLRETRS